MMKKVLVTGATGFLGKYVVEELVEHGYQVRAFGRKSQVGQSLEDSSVSFFQGDLTKAEDLLEACQGMDMVVHGKYLSSTSTLIILALSHLNIACPLVL